MAVSLKLRESREGGLWRPGETELAAPMAAGRECALHPRCSSNEGRMAMAGVLGCRVRDQPGNSLWISMIAIGDPVVPWSGSSVHGLF